MPSPAPVARLDHARLAFGEDERVGAQLVGVLLQQGRQGVGGDLLLPLDEEGDGAGQVVAPGADRGDVRHDTGLVVGRAAAVLDHLGGHPVGGDDVGLVGDAELVEGVGGLMSPLTREATGLDWAEALGLPILLVTGTYLGAISHALTAAEVLRLRGLPFAAIAVSESEAAPVPPETVAEALARRVAAPVAVVRRQGECPETLLAAAFPNTFP